MVKCIDCITAMTAAIPAAAIWAQTASQQNAVKWVSEGQGRSEMCYFLSNSGIVRCCFAMGKNVRVCET